MKYDVFISYSREDEYLVLPFCEKLQREGLSLFVDSQRIESGDDYATSLVNGLKGAKIVLLFYSRNVVNSTWCKKEIELALSMNKMIIPILLDDTELNGWWNCILGRQSVRLDGIRFDGGWKHFLISLKNRFEDKAVFSQREVECCQRIEPNLSTFKPGLSKLNKKNYKKYFFLSFVVFIIVLFVGFLFSASVLRSSRIADTGEKNLKEHLNSRLDEYIKFNDSIDLELNKLGSLEDTICDGDNEQNEINKNEYDSVKNKKHPKKEHQSFVDDIVLSQSKEDKYVGRELGCGSYDSLENIFLNWMVFLLCVCSVVSFVVGGIVAWLVYRKKIKNNVDVVEPQNDKLIKCFIAGSKSLQRERDGLRATMSVMYNKWMNFNFKILSFTFEDFDKKVVIGGQQKLYNNFIEKDADWALFIIDKGIGDKTREEFRIAMDSYINNRRPNIVIFGKVGTSDILELSIIKAEVEKHGQYWVDYSDIDNLKLSFESILNWDLINIFTNHLNFKK